MMKSNCLFILFAMSTIIANGQTKGKFSIKLPKETVASDVPFTVDVSGLGINKNSALEVQFEGGGKSVVLPAQLDADNKNLSFVIPKEHAVGGLELKGKLKNRATAAAQPLIRLVDRDGALTVESGGRNFLRYWHKVVMPPPGTDTNYKRSGFIHPLWTPGGKELTRIHPVDHYHHFGIWNPWTHTLFENDTVDFWNIKGHKGTVRFARFRQLSDGPVYARFEAIHEHVVFKKTGQEKVALNEVQTITVYKPSTPGGEFIVDFRSEMTCASQSPLLILAYRYGGLGWRATETWNKDNSEILTSEGNTRKNTDGSKARWCIAQGELGGESGGAVVMSHPGNYNHPEPLRIWDEKANGGRGDMFVNFAPTKDKDWLLEPGKKYVLNYRFLVFDGKCDAGRAESAWQAFALPATSASK